MHTRLFKNTLEEKGNRQIITRVPFSLYEKLVNIQYDHFQATKVILPLKHFINEAISRYVINKPTSSRGGTK